MKNIFIKLIRKFFLPAPAPAPEPLKVVQEPIPPKVRVKVKYRTFVPKVKKYKRQRDRCPVEDKICRSEQNAKARASAGGVDVQLRAYKCQFCPSWHLTHKKNKLTFH